MSPRPEPSGRAVYGQVDDLDIVGQHDRRFVRLRFKFIKRCYAVIWHGVSSRNGCFYEKCLRPTVQIKCTSPMCFFILTCKPCNFISCYQLLQLQIMEKGTDLFTVLYIQKSTSNVLQSVCVVATSPVVLRWLCDSPRTGCAKLLLSSLSR